MTRSIRHNQRNRQFYRRPTDNQRDSVNCELTKTKLFRFIANEQHNSNTNQIRFVSSVSSMQNGKLLFHVVTSAKRNYPKFVSVAYSSGSSHIIVDILFSSFAWNSNRLPASRPTAVGEKEIGLYRLNNLRVIPIFWCRICVIVAKPVDSFCWLIHSFSALPFVKFTPAKYKSKLTAFQRANGKEQKTSFVYASVKSRFSECVLHHTAYKHQHQPHTIEMNWN